jgi:hypothetical protein
MISKRTQQVIADGKFLTAFEGLASWLQERLEQEIVLERQRQERAATLQHILESVNSKPTLPASPGLDLTKHLPSFDPGIIEAEAWLKVIKHPSVALIMGSVAVGSLDWVTDYWNICVIKRDHMLLDYPKRQEYFYRTG